MKISSLHIFKTVLVLFITITTGFNIGNDQEKKVYFDDNYSEDSCLVSLDNGCFDLNLFDLENNNDEEQKLTKHALRKYSWYYYSTSKSKLVFNTSQFLIQSHILLTHCDLPPPSQL